MSSMSDQPTTAVDLARNVRDGVAKAVDIVDGYLARIDERDDEINAFNLVLADQARERGRRERYVVCEVAEPEEGDQ